MTNDEKIQLIGQKISLLSNNLDKYKQELAFLQNQLNELKSVSVDQTVQEIKEEEIETPFIEQVIEDVQIEDLDNGFEAAYLDVENDTYEGEPEKPFTAGLNFEEKIGARWFSIIGIITLVLGIAIGIKYAIDNDYINEMTRMVLGYLSGTIILVFALFYKKKYEVFSAILLSGAMAVMYFTTFIGYSQYHFYNAPVAFSIMAVFTGFTVFAAHIYNYEIIALIGLVGGYAVPPLLSTGSGEIQYMFGFMLILNLGILILSFKKYWKFVNHVAYGLSWLIFAAWMASSYDADLYFGRTLFFSTAFYLIFYLSFIAYKIFRNIAFSAWDVILVLSNSLIYFGIGYNAMSDEYYEQYQGLFCVVNAVIHLGFALWCRKTELSDKTIYHFILAMVISFITMAIPVQLDGNFVTLIWLCEMIVLLWMANKTSVNTYRVLSYGISLLAFFSLMHDWTNYSYLSNNTDTTLSMKPMMNRYFLIDVLGTAAYVVMWKLNRNNQIDGWRNVTHVALSVIVLFLSYITFANEINLYFDLQYKLSEFNHVSSYGDSWIDHDSSWRTYGAIWLINYSIVFVSVMGWFAIKKVKSETFAFIVWVLNLIMIFIGFTAGLILVYELKTMAVYNFTYAHISTWNYNSRYILIPFLVLLLGMLYWFRNAVILSRFKTVTTWLFHGVLLVLLSNELSHIITMLHLNEYSHYQTVATHMGFTVLWGMYSMTLIIYGILRKRKDLRVIAIVLFALTILKLVSDAMSMSTGYRLIVFIVIGIILLLVSFMYQKFKPLLMDDTLDKEN